MTVSACDCFADPVSTRQNIAGRCQQTLENKQSVGNAQQCFAFTPQTNFPTHNLNYFTDGEGNGIKSRLSFKKFSTLPDWSHSLP